MSESFKKVEGDALGLPRRERAILADRLLTSLDTEASNDIDEAWITEAERRYHEYRQGKRKPVSAQEVFSRADQLLK